MRLPLKSIIAVMAITAWIVFSFSSATAQPRIDVKVVGVSDGDMITVRDAKNQQMKVRLAGIDAPEKGQDFGNVSKQNLSALVFRKFVLLEGRKVDRYGRLIAKVFVNGIDVNLQQVRSGLAWHYKEYSNEQSVFDRNIYSEAESKARNGRLRLWSYLIPQRRGIFEMERRMLHGKYRLPLPFEPRSLQDQRQSSETVTV